MPTDVGKITPSGDQGALSTMARQKPGNQAGVMEKIVSLCKRRGFVYQSSEIYGGMNGCWDYGPLGVELKRNVRESWWQDMVTCHDDMSVLDGAPEAFEMCGLDCTILMDPQVWPVDQGKDEKRTDCPAGRRPR